MKTVWEVKGDQLVAKDAIGRILWEGQPEESAPRTVLPLNNADDCIVLLGYEHSDAMPFENLLRLSPSGRVVWRAQLPSEEPNDAYVSLSRTPEGLVANSWSGYWVRLDEASGRIIERVFTK